MPSIMARAAFGSITMHAVARASASIALGAITVALSTVVIAGRPVTGDMLCHTRPEGVSL